MRLATFVVAAAVSAALLTSSIPSNAQQTGLDPSLFTAQTTTSGACRTNCTPPPPPPPPPTRVPEPASLALLGAALGGLAFLRRRR